MTKDVVFMAYGEVGVFKMRVREWQEMISRNKERVTGGRLKESRQQAAGGQTEGWVFNTI